MRHHQSVWLMERQQRHSQTLELRVSLMNIAAIKVQNQPEDRMARLYIIRPVACVLSMTPAATHARLLRRSETNNIVYVVDH